MPSKFLSVGGTSHTLPLFEFRLDSDTLVLQGYGSEAPSALLRGSLVLCNTETIRISGLHWRLTGVVRHEFVHPLNPGHTTKYQKEFFRKEGTIYDRAALHGGGLHKGNHEYPFEVMIPGDLPESIEGLGARNNSWIIYKLKATADRGIFAKGLQTLKHVRVIRTFDPSALELAHAMSLDNIWADKIKYSISSPTKAVIFGTMIQINFEMIPLKKGVTPSKIESELFEDLRIETESEPRRGYDNKDLFIVGDTYDFPKDAETVDVEGMDGYKFSRVVRIPHSLAHCRQSVEERGIRIKHKLRFTVSLTNPEGHTSEIRATIPIHIFISPSLPLNDDNALIDQTPVASLAITAETSMAPPIYSEHHLDALYSDIDPHAAGYFTPPDIRSGNATPTDEYLRTASVDNLGPSEPIAQPAANSLLITSHYHQSHDGDDAAVSPQILSDRLNRIHNTSAGISSPRRPNLSQESSSNPLPRPTFASNNSTTSLESMQASDPSSPGHSPEATRAAFLLHPLDAESLNRVPSYNTARGTSTRNILSPDPPDYQAAVSRPPSPPRHIEYGGISNSGEASNPARASHS